MFTIIYYKKYMCMSSFSNNKTAWTIHYEKSKAKLLYPDENVVRYIEVYFRKNPHLLNKLAALDLGCGSGRHLPLLREKTASTIGQDFAENILQNIEPPTVCAPIQKLPYNDNQFDLILAWGVLHYLSKEDLHIAISEIKRVLKKGGVFFGSIRSDQDTHLKKVLIEGDLASGASQLYSKDDVSSMFSSFSMIRTGFMSRIPLGEEELIAHHIFEVIK